MWEIAYKNAPFGAISYFEYESDKDIIKKYSKGEMKVLKRLSNKMLVRICDKFMKLKYGNILHGSSVDIIRNFRSDAESAYPLIYEGFYALLCKFLDYKLKYGTAKEKVIYEGMSACDLIQRLLTKRCASYFGRNENYLLISGEKGQGDFSAAGTDNETAPLLMENCLTRDEIKLSGFILISSKVTKMVKEKSFSVVMIGIPFPILNRDGLFDQEEVMMTKKQNTLKNGYGKINRDEPEDSEMYQKWKFRSIWDDLYGIKNSTLYSSMDRKFGINKNNLHGRYFKTATHTFIDLYKLAGRLSIITTGILQEGNHRAELEKKMAYIIVDKNKIGLSSYPPIYEEIFLRNMSHEIICQFRRLNSIKLVHFVNFTEIETLKNGWRMWYRDGVYGITHPLGGIDVKFSTRDELNAEYEQILEDKDNLIVETYRLDANALPGNELWMGKVSKDQSDPSFDVRHSSIPFIHNPYVNKWRLCGQNLRLYGIYNVFNWDRLISRN